MIEATAAIDRAMDLFKTVYKESLDSGELVNLRVEEVELSADGKLWHLTLGFSHKGETNPQTVGEALAQITPELARSFKTFAIDAETGQVRSMKREASRAK